MIKITFHTRITVARNPPTTFPQILCNPITFSQVLSFLGEKKNLIDVIGVITEVVESTWAHLSSQPNPTLHRNIILKDFNDVELKITLWGQRATQFNVDNIYDPSECKPIVALFVGGLIKSYQGECYHSGNSACHWYLNPNIPEAEIFYNRYKICFFATDGTAEAEMICFGELAQRIVGKLVEALI
uniref:Replication protein A OB domain-containing protein n=1 Tax=Arundo donax TaxID=35708 RepID=A0A0A9I1Q7_ARUDO